MLPMRHWFDFLFPPRADEATLRESSVETFLALMAPQTVPITTPETMVLLPFNNIFVRAAIHEAKYHGSEHAFTLLSAALTSYLQGITIDSGTYVVIPVPLGTARRTERGFNQIEEIAKRSAKKCSVHIDSTLLKRVRETSSQVSLPRHTREENMRGAFKGTRRADPSHIYIVIDDVVTTGATLQAAVVALREVGAKHIILLALAH